MLGGVVSWTVTSNEALPWLPLPSVAVQVTEVVPRENVSPEEGEHEGLSGPEIASFADAEKLTAAPDGPVASAVIGEGTVTVGSVVSSTVTENVPTPVAEAESV